MNNQNNWYKRREAHRSIRKVLIVCEGEKTERYYFEAFQTNRELIRVEVLGTRMNTDSLVEHAVNLKKKAEKEALYSSVWCVFDRDSYPCNPNDKHNFNRAIQLAKNKQINVAYSNDAFEIWYILHFCFHQSAWERNKYADRLTELLGSKYEKNDKFMYAKLKNMQNTAIQNAKSLLASYGINHNPESNNPCTTVHLLVEFLNDYLDNE